MPDLAHWSVFLTATIILLVIPGPSVLFVVARGIDQGFRAALFSSVGLAFGDLFQVLRWQEKLYSTVPQLKQLHSSDFVVKESREFIRDFVERRRRADTYPELMRELHNSFKEAGEALEKIGVKVEREIDQMEDAGSSVTRLQKAHRDYLLKLQTLAK